MQGILLTCAAARTPSAMAVRVRREILTACMTCPLCRRLLRDATTISECLHTFCRKCILKKLNEEEFECCPICNINLGCTPIEKLRPDNNLQDVRAKIFPSKRRKVNALEVSSSLTLPVRRKERSLSSLVVNTSRVASQTGFTGRRSKVLTRRASALRGLSPATDEPTNKEGKNVENSISPETLTKMTQNKRQNSSRVIPSDHTPSKDLENGGESITDKSELWKPLNCLVEVANKTRGFKSVSQSPVIKEEQSNGADNEIHMHESGDREHPNKFKIQDGGNSSIPTTRAIVKPKRRRKGKGHRTSAQALIVAAGATRKSRSSPIWLSLVPSFNQQRDPKSTQTYRCYLRIKDRNLPVSFIHNYLAKKLNLSSDTEVEIECQGQQVTPTLPLGDLANIWRRHRPIQRIQASIGSSGKEFVVVLNYSFNAPAP